MYLINENTLAIKKIKPGILRVYETKDEFDIRDTLENLLRNSCSNNRISYEYSLSFSRNLFKNSYKVPIAISFNSNLIVFPTKSLNKSDCSLIVFNNLVTFYSKNLKSTLIFDGRKKVEIPATVHVLNTQITKCYFMQEKLKKRSKK